LENFQLVFTSLSFHDSLFLPLFVFFALTLLPSHSLHYFSGNFYSVEKRRGFFVEFAQDHNFDPLQAANWYGVSYAYLSKVKVIFFLRRMLYIVILLFLFSFLFVYFLVFAFFFFFRLFHLIYLFIREAILFLLIMATILARLW
jgi:hypothetical protein